MMFPNETEEKRGPCAAFQSRMEHARKGEGKNGEREWTRKREEPKRRIVCLFQKAEIEKVLALKTFIVTSV